MRLCPSQLSALFLIVVLAACGSPLSSTPIPPATVLPTAAAPTPTASSTFLPTKAVPTAIPTPIDHYIVRAGDTLSRIATQFNVQLAELMQLNGLSNPNAIHVGQSLKLPIQTSREAPAVYLVPDSELVYSPAYQSFDAVAFAKQTSGYLATYREQVDGEWMTGPQIIQILAERYSVGPRVLLALLEFESGWVTNATVNTNQRAYSMGWVDPSKATLFYQASWAANHLNEGYYGRLTGRLPSFQFKDRLRARIAPGVNPGSVAIENVLALTTTWDTWLQQIEPSGFLETYQRLFGNPTPIEPLLPPGLQQPPLRLPWQDGITWYFTGGPHSPWGDYASRAAIDLAPKDVSGAGCARSSDWAIAAAAGRVVRAEHGRIIVALNGGNFQGSGWSLLYMHLAPAERAAEGTMVNRGDPVGHPSCEGGVAVASHLHLARLYNGQWIDPDTIPFVLSGWQVAPFDQEYDGALRRGSESHEALDMPNNHKNAVTADDLP